MTAPSRKRLIDKLVEAYVDWREACVQVDDAYRACARETGPWGAVAFGLYVATLDAEEQAADAYAGLVRRAARLPWTQERRSEPFREPAHGLESAIVDAQYESE
ncbi:MAG TPA: hypothetical protein VIH85_12770 [Solirubrobacteraceae bacterium]|jgi:hypothetical protein